ncbi:hypothetical protein [Alkalicoccus luteus]|uniref:hypothetical protein n=1 Tax=Alkalicoccus luteus TaxID=1237094 RepID=UPI00143A62E4|nr:hypothetical protein [Alkalicoccus luteus]
MKAIHIGRNPAPQPRHRSQSPDDAPDSAKSMSPQVEDSSPFDLERHESACGAGPGVESFSLRSLCPREAAPFSYTKDVSLEKWLKASLKQTA